MKDNQTIQASSKAAEVLGANPKMIGLCQRLGVTLGFGDITMGQLSKRCGISEALFLSMCNLMANPAFVPDLDAFTKADVTAILHYLEASHKEYTTASLPHLHANIHKIAALCPEETRNIVNKFFDDFDAEMKHHIESEEKDNFAYLTGSPDDSGEHDDVEVKLDDLKNILMKYVPGTCNIPERYQAVIQVMHIADDLKFHTLVEDRILVPLVAILKKKE